jgi:hypothetical protein
MQYDASLTPGKAIWLLAIFFGLVLVLVIAFFPEITFSRDTIDGINHLPSIEEPAHDAKPDTGDRQPGIREMGDVFAKNDNNVILTPASQSKASTIFYVLILLREARTDTSPGWLFSRL